MNKQKDIIAFDELMKVDIRICKILTCVPVEKTDKLFEMTIDTRIEGEEYRNVVSAIAHQFKPEYLIGNTFPFVLNLEPIKIRGILSEAMIVLSETRDGEYVEIGHQYKSDAELVGAIVL